MNSISNLNVEDKQILDSFKDFIIGFQHVGFIVTDLDETVAKLKTLYGLEDEAIRFEPSDVSTDMPTRFAFLKVNDIEFEYIEPRQEPFLSQLKLSDCGLGGINHIAYRVHSLERLAHLLLEQGIRPGHVTPNGMVTFKDKKILYLEPDDVGGQLIELVEITVASEDHD